MLWREPPPTRIWTNCAAASAKGACLTSRNWGGELSAKRAWLDTTNSDFRQILRQYTIYNRALAMNLPFPKTRRIVFLNNLILRHPSADKK